MRELSFRALDEGDEFYYFSMNNGYKDFIRVSEILHRLGEWQQYVGYHDNKGKPIYEGDIVLYSEVVASTNPLKKGEKQFAEFRWNDFNKRIDLFVYEEDGEGYFEELDYTIRFMTVFGNIHHNPELVGKIKNENNN